jgi:HD-GYP domain-containing protein (c-di-GMP phosphodiesterase class II)
MYHASLAVIANSGSLTERLSALHTRLLETVPIVDRIACALYEAKDDQLKTFINSTRTGQALVGYEASLSNSHALSQLAQSGDFRVLDDIASAIQADTAHSQWLKAQGYQSSFTVPLFDHGKLLGFVFFDSCQRAAFTPEVQRDLVLYTSLISMMIASEMATIRAVIESTKLARELTELRDFETGAHLDRMARYSRLIARAIAPQRGLNDEFVEGVYLFAPMHDIGKIGIPDRILLKPGRLDPEERAIMDSHVAKGVEIIERIIGKEGDRHFPESDLLRNIVQHHHEMLDGSGYPQGLQGDAIPVEARIVAVADIFDALTALRPYKKEWSLDEAFAELQHLVEQGKLDAACVTALVTQRDAVADIHTRYTDKQPDHANRG